MPFGFYRDEMAFQLSLIQEQWQVRMEWYVNQVFNLIKHKYQLVINPENRQLVEETLRNLFNGMKLQFNVFPFFLSHIRKGQSAISSITNKVAPKLIKVFGEHNIISVGTGFAVGFFTYWLMCRKRNHRDCPMKPQFEMTAVTVKEPKDFKSYEGIESLQIINNLPLPRITKTNQVLIRVVAASVDSVDISILSGLGRNEIRRGSQSDDLLVLGRDLSGYVIEVGTDISNINPGDQVWAIIPLLERHGSLRDQVVVEEDFVRRKPANVSHEGAATVPYSGIMAWQSLHSVGIYPNPTTRGKYVLVIDATSPVGCLVVQLVCAWGGHAVSIVNHRHVAPLAQMLGSVQVIVVENDATFEATVNSELHNVRFDAVISASSDLGDGVSIEFFRQFLKNGLGGDVVAKLVTPNHLKSDSYGLLRRNFLSLPLFQYFLGSIEHHPSNRNRHEWRVILDELRRLVDNRQIQPVLDSSYEVQRAEEAFQRTATRSTIGKAVVFFQSRRLWQPLSPTCP